MLTLECLASAEIADFEAGFFSFKAQRGIDQDLLALVVARPAKLGALEWAKVGDLDLGEVKAVHVGATGHHVVRYMGQRTKIRHVHVSAADDRALAGALDLEAIVAMPVNADATTLCAGEKYTDLGTLPAEMYVACTAAL